MKRTMLSVALALVLAMLSAGAEPAEATDVVFVGAGDIASCSNNNDEATAVLLDSIDGTVFTLGDNAYNTGTAAEFTNCYDPTWGRHKARTMPSAGNHDYYTTNATGYYGYFGASAGDPTKGYYSYDLGGWHIVVINTNDRCLIISCAAGSAQEQWLRDDLEANQRTCTLAYWHHPRFSSSSVHGSQAYMQPVWQALYDFGADVVLSGHTHNYERFAKQTPAGAADPVRGIRQFVVGTGGRELYAINAPIANSEVQNDDSYGVLKLTLNASSYDWDFVPIAGDTFTDSGSDTCFAGPHAVGGQTALAGVTTAGANNASGVPVDTLDNSGRISRGWLIAITAVATMIGGALVWALRQRL